MPDYPILFTFRHAVAGKGFLAGIHIDGRALLTKEDGQWWAYGVDPGPVAAPGTTAIEAYLQLREALQQVFFHSAELTDTYDAFKADVEKICNQTGAADAARWETARAAIRDGRLTPEAPINDLPRQTGTVPVGCMVVRLDTVESQKFTPAENKPDQQQLAA